MKPAPEASAVAPPPRLDRAAFLDVVRNAPLVAIDLLARDARGEVLLGLRQNRPAQNWWFAPGGRIRKNERLADAFRRITREELGREMEIGSARFAGVFEHLYPDNFAGEPGVGTHYVILAYDLVVDEADLRLPEDQHREYRWLTVEKLLAADDVHPCTRAYFAGGATTSR